MQGRRARRNPAFTALWTGGILLGLCLTALLANIADVSVGSGSGSPSILGVASAPASNSSSSGDPSGSSASNLCPSAGPTILGVQWNCVAVLNLTEVVLLLAALGIVLYVFRDSDRAELPGEASEVPVTPQEEEEFREDRKHGVPYRPPEFPPEGDG
jgi:hypothetical protein